MKSSIEHIKTKLKVAMCLSTADEMNNEKVTDPKNQRTIEELPPSEDEESEEGSSDFDPHKYCSVRTSMRVSSVQENSFFHPHEKVNTQMPEQATS